MTKGGFVVGTVGMEDALRDWALAFQQLPQAEFQDLPGLDDPVRVRVCSRPDGEWCYVQNRVREPLAISLTTTGAGQLRNLAADQPTEPTLKLGGYQLVALWSPAGGVKVTGGQVADVGDLAQRLARRLAALAAKPGAQDEPAKSRLALAQAELAAGRLARVTRMLDEVWEARLAE